MLEVAIRIDDTIVDLALAIQNVGIVEDFSHVCLNEVRIAAMYLTVSVIDCLASLIEWTDASGIISLLHSLKLVLGKAVLESDFEQTVDIVHKRSNLYATALQTRLVREQQHEGILEWIWERRMKYITPQCGKEVADTCGWFFNSHEYMDWVGQCSSTLICSGKGTLISAYFLMCTSGIGEVASRVRHLSSWLF
jgi:hypothetical protein